MTDMTKDYFAEYPAGKIALSKLKNTFTLSDDFRLYLASWNKDYSVMTLTGCDFRVAKSGKHKGVLSIKIPNTNKTVYVTKEEIQSFIQTNQGV